MESVKRKIFSTQRFSGLESNTGADLFFTGINGSLNSFIISFIYEKLQSKLIFISTDSSKLFRMKDDLNIIIPGEPASIYLDKYDEEYESEVSPLSVVMKRLSGEESFILLISPETLNKSIMSESSFKKNIILLKKGDEFNFDTLIQKLNEFGYNRKQTVEEENDFAVRGGLIDILPENLSQPVRIEFFGNTVESIREFDVMTQRSISKLEQTEILPSFTMIDSLMEKETLVNYINPTHLILLDEPDLIKNEHENIIESIKDKNKSYFSIFPLSKSDSIKNPENLKEIIFSSKSQPSFNSNFKLLYSNLKELIENKYSIFLSASDDYQSKRFKELIEDMDESGSLDNVTYFDSSVHEGFTLSDEKIALYTEHQIFDRYFRPSKRKRKFAGLTFKELNKVNYGDFMVHENYGIGKYAGLKRIQVGGYEQEAVKLLYQDNDVVFVNLNSLHFVNKFSAQEGVSPKLNKLGGSEWEKIKQRTKKKIQDIAKDLILLYSKRKSIKGFKFSSDSVWQKELEASFIYEDTPDQVSATEAVKNDMESESPMDRLICGDVGFGKTEIAIRAAFKCVLDNKQAALLVPTTILAEQHYNTFKDRLSNWATEVEHISRFKSKKEQKVTLEKLEQGTLNIIIGTHRLLSKDVKFKSLGLLIIDEEQRFGVKAKEKLKFMRENVDVLTLTATPIPRTLNFSLLGARDLSIINTPPKNRQPIHTEIINMDKKVIASAITRELYRGGQVYFVNDKIGKLQELAEMIEELVPYAKVGIAHGQMKAHQLENVMMKFLEKKYNVLVCTKIIESGLDIPSVNTIIINRADNFGLAELYQLRGRVGRSNIKSFAYLITPPHSILTKQAIRRLHALEEFSELGSGLNLALRDLEIRGAGNLLGGEQSGFIAEIGFDMYMQILDEAVTEIKESELGTALGDLMPAAARAQAKFRDIAIESDISMLIPEWYIEEENIRLEIYQRLSKSHSFDELESIKDEITDRFGKFPPELENLIKHVELKIRIQELPFDKLTIAGNYADLTFILDEKNSIFENGYFEKVTAFLNQPTNHNAKLVQTKKSLILRYTFINHDDAGEKISEIGSFVSQLKEL